MIVAARLQDPGSGVNRDTIQMSLEGQALDTTYDMDRRLIYYRSEAKSGASSSLPNGRKTVTLTAKDYQGNTVEEKWSFVIDNNLPATSSPAAAPSAPRVRPPRTANPPGMGTRTAPAAATIARTAAIVRVAATTGPAAAVADAATACNPG
jgi:hypothetical protein